MCEIFSRIVKARLIGRQSLHVMLIAFLTIYFSINPAHSREVIVQGEPVTPLEASRLDPVCRLIIVEQPMVHLEQRREEYAPLFNRPEYHMAKNADWVHHRCWAMISKQRHFAAYSPTSKLKYSPKWYTRLFHDDMNYIFKVARPDWEYMPHMLYEDGEMFLIERDYANASKSAIRALQLNPKFTRAHELLADTYSQMGNKKKALETTTEGLKHDPQSKRLIRRHVELGGRPPVVKTPPTQGSSSENTVEPLPPTTQPTTTQEKPVTNQPAIDAPASAIQKPETITPEQPQSKTNPYCRFCP